MRGKYHPSRAAACPPASAGGSTCSVIVRVPTPVTDAIITLSEELLQTDFRAMGRTVEAIGIDPRWSRETLKSYLRDGVVPAKGSGKPKAKKAAAKPKAAKPKAAKPKSAKARPVKAKSPKAKARGRKR